MNDTVKINVAKVLCEALADMKEMPEKSVEKLFTLYEEHLTKAIDVTARGINHHLDHAWEVTPETLKTLEFHQAKVLLETDHSNEVLLYCFHQNVHNMHPQFHIPPIQKHL